MATKGTTSRSLRERAEDSLARALLASPHFRVAILDTDFRFVLVNEAYAESARRPADELVGLDHFELYPHRENRAIFERVRDTGEPYVVSAKPFDHPDQPDRPMTYWDWTLRPLKDEGGEVEGLVLALVDVTDHVLAERHAEERELLFRELAHRVRNNLQIVLHLIESTSARAPVPRGAMRQLTGRVHALYQVHALLEQGGDRFEIDMPSFIRKIFHHLKRAFDETDLALQIDGEVEIPFDRASSVGLVLHELLLNAFKHAPSASPSGIVRVGLETMESSAVVQVEAPGGEDEGCATPLGGRRGLGLIEGLMEQVGGSVERRFEPAGRVLTRLVFPLDG